MLIIMDPEANVENINKVIKKAEGYEMKVIVNKGEFQTVLALIGNENKIITPDIFASMDGVADVQRVQVSFPLVSRQLKKQDSIIQISPEVKIGGKNELIVMSGPCSVESEDGIIETAKAVKKAGAKILRGGAYKPRTAPRTFEGLGELGLRFLAQAKKETGLPIITELMDIRDIEVVCEIADIVQIGARNMQNFSLLNEVGKIKKPVLLKRGMSATIEEWLLAGERIINNGNEKLIFCERGIRSFDSKYTRNVFDLSAIPLIKQLSHFPIIADPSHATGKKSLVKSMSFASIMSGADGLMIETHPDPENALSDGPQSLKFHEFEELMKDLQKVHTLANELY